MEDRKLSVTLTGPAKIDGVREPAGKTVSVTTALALQLAASGVINPDDIEGVVSADMPDTPLESDFQTAVDAAVSAALVPLTAERDTLKADLETAITRSETAEKTVTDLTADLATEAAARTEAETKLAEAQAELAKLTKPDAETGKGEDGKSGKPTK
ncbi:hypothetical protein ABE530_11870 [Brucella sp. TWI559]